MKSLLYPLLFLLPYVIIMSGCAPYHIYNDNSNPVVALFEGRGVSKSYVLSPKTSNLWRSSAGFDGLPLRVLDQDYNQLAYYSSQSLSKGGYINTTWVLRADCLYIFPKGWYPPKNWRDNIDYFVKDAILIRPSEK